MKLRTNILVSALALGVLFNLGTISDVNAQDKLNEQIKNISGDVESIVIKTADGEFVFSGEEAETLFKRMQKNKMEFLVHAFAEGDTDETHNVFFDDDDVKVEFIGEDNVFVVDDADGELTWISEDGDSDVEKKINVEIEDGEKKVTVTTMVDGEETVETYEGEEAENFLKEHGKHKMMKFKADKMNGKAKVLIKKFNDEHDFDMDWEFEGEDGIDKEMELEIEDGVKKLTVTTTENGEEKVETFEGEEAEKYLEEHGEEHGGIHKLNHGGNSFLFLSDDDEMLEDAEIEKNVKVEIVDGKKKITITTTKDGNENVEVFEGDEAEKMLEEMEGDDDVKVFRYKDKAGKKVKKVKIKKIIKK